MPKNAFSRKTIEDVLLHFGETKRAARRKYREFVKKGVDQGARPEFQGGGLVRSSGGKKAGLLGRKKEEVRRETQGYWAVGISLLRR